MEWGMNIWISESTPGIFVILQLNESISLNNSSKFSRHSIISWLFLWPPYSEENESLLHSICNLPTSVMGLPGTKLPWPDGTEQVGWDKRVGLAKILCEREWTGQRKKKPWGTVNHSEFSDVIVIETTKFWCERAWTGQVQISFWTSTLNAYLPLSTNPSPHGEGSQLSSP